MQDNFTNMMLGLKVLQEQGVDTREMEAAIRDRLSKAQPGMSTTDGIYMTRSEADVPGGYEDAYQKVQDQFGAELAKRQQQQEKMSAPSGMNAPFSPIVSPNYSVVASPQRMTVGPNGQIIYM